MQKLASSHSRAGDATALQSIHFEEKGIPKSWLLAARGPIGVRIDKEYQSLTDHRQTAAGANVRRITHQSHPSFRSHSRPRRARFHFYSRSPPLQHHPLHPAFHPS